MSLFETSTNREDTNAEKYALRQKLFKTEDVLPAWVADMDIDTPSFVIQAVKKRLMHPVFGYEEFPESAKEAQISWIKRYHDTEFEKEFILQSHSVVASISTAILAFSEIGDEVIVQTPIYPPFFKQVIHANRKVVYNPLKKNKDLRYTFDIDDLKSKITKKTKLLLLCNPHNPVGRSWNKEELEQIKEICLENDIKVFSDEIHSDLVLNSKHIPFVSLDEADKITITAYGVGKTFNMSGFAISTVLFKDEELFERYKKRYDMIHFAQNSSISHVAFEAAYKNGDEWLSKLKKHLWQNYTRLKDLTGLFDFIDITPLEATYLAWLDCNKMDLSDKELREWFVKEAKLGLSPGISFGRDGSGFMRLNFGVSVEIMDKIVSNLKRGLKNYANQLG